MPEEDGLISRRSLLVRTSGIGATLLTAGAAPIAALGAPAKSAAPVVSTRAGKLRGAIRDGVHVFRGVPYGESTEGARRFLSPLPVKPWTGIREATAYGPLCPQPAVKSMVQNPQLAAIFGLNANDPEPATSEDCLSLNVWTPDASAAKRRTVLFWLHGGGYTSGGGTWRDDSSTDGFYLAKKHDVVVVTINHRLASFGFANFGGAGGVEFEGSGTRAFEDMILALEWVRDNIGAFGGDPAQVTIFGESGGGAKVSTLLAIPAAEKLFKTAVVESGPEVRGRNPANVVRATQATMQRLGLKPEDVKALQAVPADKLVEVQGGMMTAPWGPSVGTPLLPQAPFEPVAAPSAATKPLIIGATKDEANTFLIADPKFGSYTDQDVVDRLRPQFGSDTDAILAAYRAQYPGAMPTQILVRVMSDVTMARSLLLADRKAAAGPAPVYVYKFAYETNMMEGRLGAPHAIDIPFNFDATEIAAIAGTSPARFKVARQMAISWISFARTGNPDNPSIPHWPRHEPGANRAMWIDTEWSVRPALPDRIFALWRATPSLNPDR